MKKIMLTLLPTSAFCLLFILIYQLNTASVAHAGGATFYVNPDGLCGGNVPCFTTIQGAVDTAVSGDLILINAATYVENVNINKDLTLQGDDAATTIVDGAQSGSVFTITTNTAVSLSNVTATNGFGSAAGGGVHNEGSLQLNNAIIFENQTDEGGGGIRNNGVLTVTNSHIYSNISSLGGGGIANYGSATMLIEQSTIENNIDVGIVNRGTMIINSSTINNNQSGFSVNIFSSSGIANESGELTILNSTISNNQEDGLSVANGTVSIVHSTINDRTTYSNGDITLQSNILLSCANVDGGAGSLTSLGHNVSAANNCALNAFGDKSNQTLALGVLQDNGGSTHTHAISFNSPAFEAGSLSLCTSPSINGQDQRGVSRPQGHTCDAGAFEFEWTVEDTIFLPLAIR